MNYPSEHLSIIDPDAEELHKVLGITDKRIEDIEKSVEKAIDEKETIAEAAQIFLKDCKHINEAYVAIFYQATIELGKRASRNLFRV